MLNFLTWLMTLLFENLEEIKMFLNSDDYKNVRTFSVEYQVDFNGKLEKAINQ